MRSSRPFRKAGLGAVYLARRVLLGDEVAIKVMLADQEGPAPLERFVRDYGEEGNLVYLVTDLIEGPSMRQLLTQGRLLGKMLSGAARDPRELQPRLPERAATAILTALNTVPEKRHAGARGFAKAFGTQARSPRSAAVGRRLMEGGPQGESKRLVACDRCQGQQA